MKLPRGHFDWFSVATLWLGAAIMAIRAGDLPLIAGAPSFFTSSLWGYVPFLLISFYGVVAISSRIRSSNLRQEIQSIDRPIEKSKALTGSAPDSTQDGRIFLAANVDLNGLSLMCEGKTSVHAQQAVQPYIGKWLRYRGRVKNVSLGYDNSMRISFRLRDLANLIAKSKKDSSLSDVLHVGDEIEVIGKIERISQFEIEIVEVEVIDR